MAKQAQDLTSLIAGTLKFVEPTDRKDSSKRIIWKAECICGEFEYGSRPQLEKFAGHSTCPGHPFKGQEKPIEGFCLSPEHRESPEHVAALAAWEAARHREPSKDETNKPLSTGESKVLRERLGLSGYRTETITLTQSVSVLGCQAEKVIFAKALDGDDRILLHLQLIHASGKRSIVSSRKKVPEGEWNSVAERLAEMKIQWRARGETTAGADT
jgi:hypothetical protein